MKKILLLMLVLNFSLINAHNHTLNKAVQALDVKKVHDLLVTNQINEFDRLEALEQITQIIEKPSTASKLLNISQMVSSTTLLWLSMRFIKDVIKHNPDDCAYIHFLEQFWEGASAKVLARARLDQNIYNLPLIAASGALFVMSAQSLIGVIKKMAGKENRTKAIAIQCMLSIAY